MKSTSYNIRFSGEFYNSFIKHKVGDRAPVSLGLEFDSFNIFV